MENPRPSLENFFNIAVKIRKPISLGALVLLVLYALARIGYLTDAVLSTICFIYIIAILGFIADIHMNRGTLPQKGVNTPVNISKDLRVKEEIWRNLDAALDVNGFTKRERNDSEKLMGESFEFSWAGGNTSLFIVQLKSRELSAATVLQLRGMKSELESKEGRGDIRKIVIICDEQHIFDALHHSVIGSNDLVLLTHYSIDEIKEKDAGSAHLQKLLLYPHD